jgi:hypothetical protein
MTKNRAHIPKKISEDVLKEFNYRCAKCGADHPHLHHIDEDPSNNKPLNLIPLCPNCHLIDQHNPTRSIDPKKLRLFREYKDPAILKPQFHPIFLRLQFLDADASDHTLEELENKAIELCEFILTFEKGEFYARVIGSLIIPTDRIIFHEGYPRYKTEEERDVRTQEYCESLKRSREQVYSLVVESLRFQPWA